MSLAYLPSKKTPNSIERITLRRNQKQQSFHHFKAKIAAGLAHGIKYQKTIVWYGSIKRVQRQSKNCSTKNQ